MAKVSTFTEVNLETVAGSMLHGNLVFNVYNPADELYYPAKLNIDGSATSDDGIIRRGSVDLYIGTPQADKFETVVEIYQACPAFLKPTLKDLGVLLVDVDYSQ